MEAPENNDKVSKDLSRRVGAVRRLLPHISRGRLLREIGSALVIGKANYGCWVTRKARVTDDSASGIPQQNHSGQVALNDLARVLTGYTRKDRISVKDLADKAGIPTLNELVVKRASLEAWKARNGGVLSGSASETVSNTRAATNKQPC